MSTALLVRREAAADRRTVETLVRDAFWNVYQPGATEHAVLHRLREDEAFIPELSLVAVLDGTIAGHVAGVRGVIHGRDGRDRSVRQGLRAKGEALRHAKPEASSRDCGEGETC